MAADSKVSLNIAHVFGSHCGGAVREAAFFGDDSGYTLIHPAGRHLSITNTETGEANIIQTEEKSDAVLACAISRDRKLFAVCERQPPALHPSVAIHDLTTLVGGPVQRMDAFGSSFPRAVGLAFSSPARDASPLLCVVSSGQEPTVSVLDWKSNRIAGKIKVPGPIDRVAWTPQPFSSAGMVISISGPHVLRLLSCDFNAKTKDASLEVLPCFAGLDEQAVRIADHAWMEPGDGKLVAITGDGSAFVLSSDDLVVTQRIQQIFGAGVMCTPFCVRCFSQGFMVAGSEGKISVWEKVEQMNTQVAPSDQKEAEVELAHRRTIRARSAEAAIVCIDITGAEESILVGFKDADMGLIKLSSLYVEGKDVADCTIIYGGSHSGPVTCLDVAVQRPLALSMCRKDCSVRIWNYATRQCELCWRSPSDPPYAVALHPFGYFAAVALKEVLRCFFVTSSELRPHCELPVAGVGLLRFSHGGHLLAAAQGDLVLVFSLRVVKQIATLEKHDAQVTSICFDPEDQRLWTCDREGALFEWDTQTWELVNTDTASGCEYSSVASNAGSSVASAGFQEGRGVLRKFKHGKVDQERQLDRDVRPSTVCQYTGSGTMFVATSAGSVLTYAAGSQLPVPLGLHVGRCTSACLAPDGRNLLTAGEDGAIFVLSVQGLADGDADRGEPDSVRVAVSDVMLVDRAYANDLQRECESFRAENAALRAKLQRERELLEGECETNVREARSQDESEIAELARRCAALEMASSAKDRESSRVLSEMQLTHQQAAEQLEHLYHRKLEYEAERFVMLEAAKERIIEQIEDVKRQMLQRDEEERERDSALLKRQLAEMDAEIQKHKDLLAFTQQRFDSMLDRQGVEHDHDVHHVRLQNLEEQEAQKEVEEKLKREHETLLKGAEFFERDHKRIDKEQSESTAGIKELKEQKEELEKVHAKLSAEKQERVTMLQEKERKIESYKEKVSILKKFKQYLDDKCNEAMELNQPKDDKIERLNADLRELEAEFEKQLMEQRSIEGIIDTKKQQISHLTNELDKLRATIRDRDRTIASYSSDLHKLVHSGMEPKTWQPHIRELYYTHVKGERVQVDRLPVEEMQRQMRQVERRVHTLALKGANTKEVSKTDIQKKAQEGAELTRELNELRMQKKSLQREVRSLSLKLAQLEQPAPAQALENGGAGGDALPPVSSPGALPSLPGPPPPGGVPRVPSGGGLPGPRQASTPPAPSSSSVGAARMQRNGSAPMVKDQRPKDVPLTLQATTEEQKRLESLKLTAEMTGQQLRVQQMENEVLRRRIDALLDQAQGKPPAPAPGAEASGDADSAGAAGAAEGEAGAPSSGAPTEEAQDTLPALLVTEDQVEPLAGLPETPATEEPSALLPQSPAAEDSPMQATRRPAGAPSPRD